MLVIGQCNGQLKEQLACHGNVSGQNVSCAHAVALHFATVTWFFFMKTVL